jgi:uridine monophosphate synthetase
MQGVYAESDPAGLAIQLYLRGIVRFGEFKLRSGEMSKIYFDLRSSISYPDLIKMLAQEYIHLYNQSFPDLINISPVLHTPVRICGIAYTGIPIATAISQLMNVPMIMKRKEAKDYGTKKLIEGSYDSGDQVILIDDVITSGGSILETIEELEKAGLVIRCILVLIDRRSSEQSALLNGKYPIYSVYSMNDLLRNIKKYVRTNPFVTKFPQGFINNLITYPSFTQRSQLAKSQVGVKLMSIMEQKKSNLILSADVVSSSELLKLADELGSEICMIKTHMDMIEDFNYQQVIPALQVLAKKHNFLIMEDRKFADIGNTVLHQYTGGVHKISEWADLVTVHGLLGEGILNTFSQVCREDQGIMLIAQLSNSGNLIDTTYTSTCVDLANKYPKLVAGLICGEKLSNNLGILHCTPGVNLNTSKDQYDQQYTSPEWVIGELESDLIIVGRGIYQSESPLESARKYRSAAWSTYSAMLGGRV